MKQEALTIEQLIKNQKAFQEENFIKNKTYKTLVEEGQQPKIMVIGCSDSRVDPAIITQSQAGDLFVVRNVANLVPPCDSSPRHHGTSSALEFAVKTLGVTDIIVLGHSHCGGIQALMNKDDANKPSDFINAWVNIAKTAKEKVCSAHPNIPDQEKATLCGRESLRISLNNLMTFPWIKSRVVEGNLRLHGWYFYLETGEIETL